MLGEQASNAPPTKAPAPPAAIAAPKIDGSVPPEATTIPMAEIAVI